MNSVVLAAKLPFLEINQLEPTLADGAFVALGPVANLS